VCAFPGFRSAGSTYCDPSFEPQIRFSAYQHSQRHFLHPSRRHIYQPNHIEARSCTTGIVARQRRLSGSRDSCLAKSNFLYPVRSGQRRSRRLHSASSANSPLIQRRLTPPHARDRPPSWTIYSVALHEVLALSWCFKQLAITSLGKPSNRIKSIRESLSQSPFCLWKAASYLFGKRKVGITPL
jgi:hypothetical protein